MKQAFTRLGIYCLILFCFTAIYRAWPEGPLEGSTTGGVIAYYASYFLVGWGFWLLIFEIVFQIIKRIRKKPG